jgi:hypothetical protein
MKTVLRNIRIIAIFVYWMTIGFHTVNNSTTGEPTIYKERLLPGNITIYKGCHANVHPSCTISQKVISVQTKC